MSTTVNMISKPPTTGWLFVCAYVSHTVFPAYVLAASNVVTEKFTCSQLCISQGTFSFPVSYEAASRIQCAVECSKRSWCNSYIFETVTGASTSSLQLPPKPCRLYIDASSQCSATPTATSVAGVCVKSKPIVIGVSPQACSISSERVLEVVNSKPYIPQGQEYLSTILTSGNSLKVQFSKGTSQYAVKANYYTFITGIYGGVCISVPDSMSGFDSLTSTSSRSFCANGSQAVYPLTTGLAEQFYWDMELLHKQPKQNVYTTGDTLSNLLSAINNGFDITVIFITNNKVVHADIVTHNVKTHETTTQTRMYENGQESIISHTTDGTTMTITWAPLLPALSSLVSGTSQSVWLADSCWTFICSTITSSTNPIPNFKESFESGRRIRVKITIDDLIIFAIPDMIESDRLGTITAHVFRVLVQESPVSSGGILGGVVNTIGGLLGTQSQSQSQSSWAHYAVSSNGTLAVFKTQIGLSECTYTSRSARVDWFEQIQNWTRVHTSSFGNVATIPLLAAKVLNGSDVRVKVEVAGAVSWFSCDMLEVVNNGQDVKCHVSGQVSVSTSDSSPKSLLGGITTLLSSAPTATCSIRSVCMTITASTGTTGNISSCLWQPNLPLNSDPRPKLVNWFVL